MRLGDWLTHNGLNEAEFARRLAVTRVTVGRWVDGTRIPEREMMPRIVAATDGHVTANDFYGLTPAAGAA